jgi:hypothetical protein
MVELLELLTQQGAEAAIPQLRTSKTKLSGPIAAQRR